MKKLLISALTVLLTLSMLMTGSISAFADDSSALDIETIPSTDWMRFLPDNAYITALNVPGTHDSGLFQATMNAVAFAQCQWLSIKEQLAAGVRFFDIRLRYGGDPDDVGTKDEIKQLYVCHGQGIFCCDGYTTKKVGGEYKTVNYTYEMVLDDMASFLEAHPDETIFYFVRNEYLTGDEKKSDDEDDENNNLCYMDVLAYDEALLAKRFENSPTDENGRKKNDFEVLDSRDNYSAFHNMTLGECRGRMFRFENEYGFGSLMNERKFNDWDSAYNDKWDMLKPFFDSAPAQTMFVPKTRTYVSEEDEKAHPETFRAAYTSCTGVYTYDEDGNKTWNNVGIETIDIFDLVNNGAGVPTGGMEALSLNPILMDYGFDLGAYYGWIAFDMVTEDLSRMIFETNDFGGTGEVISRKKVTYIKDIAGFCDLSYDDAVQLCYSRGYTPVPAKVNSNGRVSYDINPDGYPIVLGYTTTTDPSLAATDIVGRYDDDKPGDYNLVIVYNSLRNNFTRGTGLFTKNTYLFVSHNKSKAPITALEIMYGTNPGISDGIVTRDLDGDKPVGSSEIFNLQEGVEINGKDFFLGLKMVRDSSASTKASMFASGSITVIVGCIVALALAIPLVILIIKNKELKKKLTAKEAE